MASGLRVSDSLRTSALSARREGFKTALTVVWVLVALALVPSTRWWSIFAAPQRWAYDRALDWRPARVPNEIVIVAIDERSINQLGRFPWSRRVHARLLRRLKSARAVGLDVLFADPEGGPDGAAADEEFARAIAEHGRVVLAMHIARNPQVTGAVEGPLPGWLPLRPEQIGLTRPWRVRPEVLTPPISPLAKAAAGIGFVDVRPDADGIYRRATLFVSDGRRLYGHFALELARVALGVPRGKLTRYVKRRHVALAAPLSFDARGRALVNFCGPSGTVRRVSYCDVLAGRVKEERLKDKVVIVGATAAGLYDVRPAPFSRKSHFYLGAELNASLCDTLLQGPGLTDLSRSPLWIAAGGLVATAAVAAVWAASESWVGVFAGAGLAATAVLGFFAALYGANVVLPVGPTLAATAAGWLLSTYRRLTVERNVVRQHFAAYVSPEVLAHLMSHPELVEEGQRREVTILFADIRQSTALAEAIPAERWIAQLNEYLTAMSEVILAFEGYLDKFMGDGIMAIWNAFGTQPYHRDLALRAAVAMLQRLDELNARWEKRPDRVALRIGIGLHTGEAIVGNVGSAERTQFTAIGDTVNAAARIEAATKQFGVPLVFSEAVVERLVGKYNIVELGQAQLRGRSEPVRLYSLSFAVGGEESAAAAQETSEAVK